VVARYEKMRVVRGAGLPQPSGIRISFCSRLSGRLYAVSFCALRGHPLFTGNLTGCAVQHRQLSAHAYTVSLALSCRAASNQQKRSDGSVVQRCCTHARAAEMKRGGAAWRRACGTAASSNLSTLLRAFVLA